MQAYGLATMANKWPLCCFKTKFLSIQHKIFLEQNQSYGPQGAMWHMQTALACLALGLRAIDMAQLYLTKYLALNVPTVLCVLFSFGLRPLLGGLENKELCQELFKVVLRWPKCDEQKS